MSQPHKLSPAKMAEMRAILAQAEADDEQRLAEMEREANEKAQAVRPAAEEADRAVSDIVLRCTLIPSSGLRASPVDTTTDTPGHGAHLYPHSYPSPISSATLQLTATQSDHLRDPDSLRLRSIPIPIADIPFICSPLQPVRAFHQTYSSTMCSPRSITPTSIFAIQGKTLMQPSTGPIGRIEPIPLGMIAGTARQSDSLCFILCTCYPLISPLPNVQAMFCIRSDRT
jgi:hypothetical protein